MAISCLLFSLSLSFHHAHPDIHKSCDGVIAHASPLHNNVFSVMMIPFEPRWDLLIGTACTSSPPAPIINGHQLFVDVSIITNHLHPYMLAGVGGTGKLMIKVIEFHPPLSQDMAAQVLVPSTTAPPSTSSGRWKGVDLLR